MKLLMIVPTHNRPQNASYFYTAWCGTVSGDTDLLFVVDEDDPQLGSYQNQMAWMPRAQLLIAPSGLRMVGVLNWTAIQFAGDYEAIGFFGDDHRPRSRSFDVDLCKALTTPVGIAYGNDFLQGAAMPTAVVMTSNIVKTLNYMAPPSMRHICVDLCWKLWGERLGVLSYLDHVVVEHMHPANGKALTDAGYRAANSPEQIKRDSEAYYAYVNNGQLDRDVAALRELM